MRKQKIQLVVVLVLLVAVLLSFLLLRLWNRREQQKEASDRIPLLSLDAADVTTITVMTEAEGTRYQLVRDGEGWKVTDASGIEETAKTDTVQQMLDAVITLEGTHPIGNVEDYAQYGLDPPGMTIGIRTENEASETHVIRIGDLSTGASMYYARMNDAGEVYLITTLVKSLYDVQPDTLIAKDTDTG